MTNYTLSRIGLAFIWLYNGLMLKLIFRPNEVELFGIGSGLQQIETWVMLVGSVEAILGCLVLYFWRSRWPTIFSIILFAALLLAGILLYPYLAVRAFCPIPLSISAILFGLINLQQWNPDTQV